MKIHEILTTIGVALALALSIFNAYTTYFVDETPELTLKDAVLYIHKRI